MKDWVKKAIGLGDPHGVFDVDERVSAGMGSDLVRRDHGDQAGVSDISISTPPDVAARKLSKLEAPETDKALILIRAGFQTDTISYILDKAREMADHGRPASGD